MSDPEPLSPLRLKVIVGSTREGRAADLVLPWLLDRAGGHGAFSVDVLDLRDRPRNPVTDDSLTLLLDDLAWWGDALRRAREAGELPPALARRAPGCGLSERSGLCSPGVSAAAAPGERITPSRSTRTGP